MDSLEKIDEHKDKTSGPEEHPAHFHESVNRSHTGPIVRRNEGVYEMSIDGSHFIDIPERIAKLIRLALHVQKEIDADPLSLNREYDSITGMVKGINCHKTTLFIRGDISKEQLVNTAIEAEYNGHPEIITLANENPNNLHFFSGDIREYAREHLKEFPFSVHVLVRKGSNFVPAHSFMWLKTDDVGNEICFHKAGPYLDMGFEVTTLKDALEPYDTLSSVFMILPLRDGKKDNKNTTQTRTNA